MGKLIFLILIGAGIYFFFIKNKENGKTDTEEENEFIACSKCGTFVLKKEMKEKDGKLLCKDCYENS
jgi:uncharacterized protein